MAARFEVYRDARSEYRFRLRDADGNIVAQGDSYPTREAAYEGCREVRSAAAEASVEDYAPRAPRPDACPDGGTCHHGCTSGCFRVAYAGPLSGVYPGDTWPADVLAANETTDGRL